VQPSEKLEGGRVEDLFAAGRQPSPETHGLPRRSGVRRPPLCRRAKDVRHTFPKNRSYVLIIKREITYYRLSDIPPRRSVIDTLFLREVLTYLRRSHAVGLAVLIAVAYALGSMILGGMLILARLSGGYSVVVYWGSALGYQSWNFPLVLIEAPWGYVEFPFFATISMVLVSVGVGLGMAVAIVLSYRLIKDRRTAAGRSAATGAIAGLTPAMIALVTLGACCSVTAAATAGVGLVAQASGSSTSNLLVNNWYLGVFQIVVVYVALIAQELLLRVYGGLFATSDPAFAHPAPSPSPITRRTVATAFVRACLLAGGITWALAAVADWATINPVLAPAGVWFNWLVEHWLLGGLAVLVALAPSGLNRWFRWVASTAPGGAVRAGLLVAAWSLGGWMPPPLAAAGVVGFGNELLGTLGAAPAVGAMPPPFPWGAALLLRWAFQLLLLAVFAGVTAVSPRKVLDWFAPPSPRPAEGSAAASARTGLPDAR